jgi:hypothetical protein
VHTLWRKRSCPGAGANGAGNIELAAKIGVRIRRASSSGRSVIHRGGISRDYTLLARAINRQRLPGLQIGAESFHRCADAGGGLPSTGI